MYINCNYVKFKINLVYIVPLIPLDYVTSSELDQLLEDAPLPFIMQHAPKITEVRKRVSSLNSVLRTIQRRIDNVDRILTSKIHRGTNIFALREYYV